MVADLQTLQVAMEAQQKQTSELMQTNDVLRAEKAQALDESARLAADTQQMVADLQTLQVAMEAHQ